MSPRQDRFVLGALLLTESTWLYAGFAVLGTGMGIDGSPLGWTAVLVIMAVSLVVGRVTPLFVQAIELEHLGRAFVGAVLIYLLTATQISSGEAGLEFGAGWPLKMGSEPHPYGARAAGAVALGALLWLRAAWLAMGDNPKKSLGRSFGLGIVVLGLALISDTALEIDLNIASLIFFFFGAGLAGLSMGNLLQSRSRKMKSWPKLVGVLVVGVVLIGLLASLIQGQLLSNVSNPLSLVLGAVVVGVVWAIIVPIGLVVSLFFSLLLSFFGREDFNPDLGGAAEATPRPTRDLDELLEGAQSQELSVFENILAFVETVILQGIQVVVWVLPLIIAIAALVVVARAIRRMRDRRTGRKRGGQREYVGDDADYVTDFANLLWKLFPNRFKRRGRKGSRIPKGPPGIVEVFRIYYRLLKTAEDRGVARTVHQTTAEFQKILEGIFPGDLAHLATEYFDHACYGHHPATDEQLDRLRASLRQSTASPAK